MISRRPAACRFPRCCKCAGGDGRGDNVDTTSPLLIVYTSGTTGHPKGAVLRQDALVANAAMSQHMHDMTAQDHMLTVLPLFHVGGLNIQTTPALQLGATVTLHARFAPEATLDAIARDRPTLTVLVPATIQAMIEHPRWDGDQARQPARRQHRVDAGAAAPVDAFTQPRHAGAAGLRLHRDKPGRGLYAAFRRLAPAGLDGTAGPPVRGARRRRRWRRGAGGHGRRSGGARPQRAQRILEQPARRRRRRCATAGTTAATSACAMRTGISSSTTARRT